MTNSEFMMAIMSHLKNHNPAPDKYHYWMMKMNDMVSSRIIRAPADDDAQAEMAEKVVAGTYGLYVSNTANPSGNPDGKFMLTFSSTQEDDEGQFSTGEFYLADQNNIATAVQVIIHYLNTGALPIAQQ